MRARRRRPSLAFGHHDRRRTTSKVSKDSASETIALDGVDVKLEHLEGGYSVCFESHTADGDLAELFRGLPGDRCQLPRWGYVIEGGRSAFRFAGPRGDLQAGDAYYVRPATRRFTTAGAEIVEFTPTDALAQTIRSCSRTSVPMGWPSR